MGVHEFCTNVHCSGYLQEQIALNHNMRSVLQGLKSMTDIAKAPVRTAGATLHDRGGNPA